jgi:hypothetical protein
MNISQWVDAVIEDSAILADHPDSGMFTLYCDNAKRRGVGRPVQRLEIEGTLYSSGHVHLDTQALHICDFLSLQQMLDQLDEWGNRAIVWHKEASND